ncbi:MAG TPA: hypothetical protein ENJ68_01610 [Devosia sp.]|nr:hypothetical protein [Devosia sp.]
MDLTARERSFLSSAHQRYRDANAAALDWMLDRPPLQGVFPNTKLNPLTLQDYTSDDGVRGPRYVYGWIAGRALEALATFAGEFQGTDPERAARLDRAGQCLFGEVARLYERHGHGCFCYDRNGQPLLVPSDGPARPQHNPDGLFTYSDAFFAKGLLAAAARHDREQVPRFVRYLHDVVAAIGHHRFQIDERVPLSRSEIAVQPDDYGPRMILLGAAPLLQSLGLDAHADFAGNVIRHVMHHHLDARSGLLRLAPGVGVANPGHQIEFVGFAMAWLSGRSQKPDPALIDRLTTLLIRAFAAGFDGVGIATQVSVSTGQPLTPLRPWWSLPETIRAAALIFRETGNRKVLDIWQQADRAFFARYWRTSPPIAYQTLTEQGPVDAVPSTPDLDPCYHTGLSLLAAQKTAGLY